MKCSYFAAYFSVLWRPFFFQQRLLLGLLILVPGLLFAQTLNLKSHQLTDEDGLSHNTVTCIVQDPLGFMWFGTRNGLNRYDGYAFQTFTHDPTDSTSLGSSNIGSMMIDSAGFLWVSTRANLHRIDPISLAITSIPFYQPTPQPGQRLNTIIFMYTDRQDSIWIGTSLALLKVSHYDPAHPQDITYNVYKHLPGYPDISLQNTNDILEHSDGSWWIASTYGVIYWNKANGYANNRLPEVRFDDNSCLCEPQTFELAEGSEGGVWAATLNGLVRIQKENDSTFHQEIVLNTYKDNGRPNTNTFLVVDRDAAGNMWAGTYSQGLFFYDKTSESFRLVEGPSQSILALYQDHSHNLYVGSDGVHLFPAHPKPFYQTFDQTAQKLGLKDNEVYAFEEDSEKNLWVAHKNGLSRFSASGDTVHYFDQKDGMDFLFVVDIEAGENGDMWFLAKGALLKYEASSQQFSTIRTAQTSREEQGVVTMLNPASLKSDDKGNLWISTFMGVLKFDPHTETFDTYLRGKGNYVNTLHQDQKGRFWAGDATTFSRFDPTQENSFIPFKPANINAPKMDGISIRDIHHAQNEICWVATISGLFRVDFSNDSLSVFTEKDGLPANYIRAIEEDDHGRLWLATDGGLSRFDPPTATFKNFKYKDHFDIRFYSRVSYRASDGTLLFGGSNGYIRFHPDSIQDDPVLPPVYLTDFKIGFEKIPIGAPDPNIKVHDFFLEKPLLATKNIDLSYKERTLTFQFSALHYAHPDENQFAYQMEGFDENWIHTDAFHRSATYTNLDPGDYTFRVKASNHDGVWNEEGVELAISISPPWWKTWWAFFIYGTIISSFFILYLYYRIRKVAQEYETQARIERAKVEERESVRKRSSRDFHDEAGNKLTKLSLYTELTKRKAVNDPEVLDYLGHIEQNVKELATGMRDFIWVLDPEKDSLIETLGRIRDFGSSLFEHSDTAFEHHLDTDALAPFNLSIKAKRHLLLIFKEAMNNCLKYSQAGKAVFSANLASDELLISFRDDGKGFDMEKRSNGNGLKNMQTRANELGGKMELKSQVDEGTEISLYLQITHMGNGVENS